MQLKPFTPRAVRARRSRYVLMQNASDPITSNLTDAWQRFAVFSPFAPQDPIIVEVRRADCGAGCRCAAEIRACSQTPTGWLAEQATFIR